MTANLNKLLADKRASIQQPRIQERERAEVQEVFKQGWPLDRIYFPVKSSQVPNRPALALVVVPPEQQDTDEARTLQFVDSITKQCGTSDRTFKSALIWCVPDSGKTLYEEARKLLAWEDVQDEASDLKLDETQRRQLSEHLGKSRRDLREAVWRTYKTVMLLGKDNAIRSIDLGLVHSSAADSLVGFIVNRLKQDGDISEGISPKFLVRNWSGAHTEWSTKAVKDAVLASPLFPRLLNGDLIRDTIARGVSNSILAYVGKTAAGRYEPFLFGASMSPQEVEISEDVFVITAETAQAYRQAFSKTPEPAREGTLFGDDGGATGIDCADGIGGHTRTAVETTVELVPAGGKARALTWSGEVPAQKWMNFYTKVLAKFATSKGLRLTVKVMHLRKPGCRSKSSKRPKPRYAS